MNTPHGHTCIECGVRYRPCVCEWPESEVAGNCPSCRQDAEADVAARLMDIRLNVARGGTI